MRLKNYLIVVSDIDKSKEFYHDICGLIVIRDFGENVIFIEGLVLQEQKSWEQLMDKQATVGNASELFFEENDFDAFLLKIANYNVKIVTDVRVNSWGKRAVQIYDPDGHIIEVSEK